VVRYVCMLCWRLDVPFHVTLSVSGAAIEYLHYTGIADLFIYCIGLVCRAVARGGDGGGAPHPMLTENHHELANFK